MPNKQQIAILVHQLLQEQATDPAITQLNVILDTVLNTFPIPTHTNDTVDLGVYVLSDNVLHFYTDNYADLPDALYPLAKMRVVAVCHSNRKVLNPTRLPGFAEFATRYSMIKSGKYTHTSTSNNPPDTKYIARKQQSAREGIQADLTAAKWLHAWNDRVYVAMRMI